MDDKGEEDELSFLEVLVSVTDVEGDKYPDDVESDAEGNDDDDAVVAPRADAVDVDETLVAIDCLRDDGATGQHPDQDALPVNEEDRDHGERPVVELDVLAIVGGVGSKNEASFCDRYR